MKKKILIDAHFPTETRIALVDKNNLVESFEYKSDAKSQSKSNIYLAKITRVEPSLQAAFVDYGDNKSGFLSFDEIHQDYFHVPVQVSPLDEKSEAEKSTEGSKKHFDNKPNKLISNEINNEDEIDLERLKQLVDNKVQSDFEIDAYEDEIDPIKDEGSSRDRQAGRIDRSSYRIQEVLKKGQVLLVQITKEGRANKGASLTTYISLAGKYSVLMPNTPDHNGISRKISNADERKRLKSIISDLSKLNNNKASIIIRTAGAGHSPADIKRDFEYLTKLWNQIRELTLKSTAPSFIHSEDSLILKTVRDLFDSNVKEVFVQGSEAFKQCLGFVRDMMPHQISAVKEYKGKIPIFTKYGVEDQLIKLYQTNVQLPSGGYIVINPTEALISIDVNSGKSTSEKNVEETALKTNLEAAREIARQAKLRDLAGLLVLDFIDMSEAKNRKIVERALKEFLSKDKARIQTSSISVFGLLEMSRQRLRPSFLEANSKMCTHCGGKGLVRAEESNAMLILRTIENEIHDAKCDIVNVYGISSSILHLLNNKKSEISFIENKYEIKLNFYIDSDATSDSYSIETVKESNQKSEETIPRKPLLQKHSISYGDEEVLASSSRKKIAAKPGNRDPNEGDSSNSEKGKTDDGEKKESKLNQSQNSKSKRDNQDRNQQNSKEDVAKKSSQKKMNQEAPVAAVKDNNSTDKDLVKDSTKQEVGSKHKNRQKQETTGNKEVSTPKQNTNYPKTEGKTKPEPVSTKSPPAAPLSTNDGQDVHDKSAKLLDKKTSSSRKRINRLNKQEARHIPVNIFHNITAAAFQETPSSSLMNATLIASELIAQGVVSEQPPTNPMKDFGSYPPIQKPTQIQQAVNNKKAQPEASKSESRHSAQMQQIDQSKQQSKHKNQVAQAKKSGPYQASKTNELERQQEIPSKDTTVVE